MIVESLMELVSGSLIHGSVLALLTALACATVLRGARPAVHFVLWTVVLLKFLMPPVIPAYFSLSGLISSSSRLIPTQSGEVAKPERAFIAPVSSPAEDTPSVQIAWFNTDSMTVCLIVAYLLGLLFVVGQTARQLQRLREDLKQMQPASGVILHRVGRLSRSIGLRSPPSLLFTQQECSPFVVGLVRPKLVIPVKLFRGLTAELKDALLVHELAHIKRGDLWVRLLENMARLLFYFWPPVRWVCRRIDRAAELACDQWAVSVSRISPRVYASALLMILKRIPLMSPSPQRIAFARKGTCLEERFEMILKRNPSFPPSLSWLFITVLGVWALFALGGTTGIASAPEEVTKNVKRLVLHTEGGQDEIKLDASIAPEADLDGDGFLNLEELQAYADANPDVVTLEIRPGEDGDHIALSIESTGEMEAHVHQGHVEAGSGRKIIRVEKIVDVSGEDELIFVDEDGNVTMHEAFIHEAPHGAMFIKRLPDPDPEVVLQRHPEADLDGDGVLSEGEMKEFQLTHGPDKDVFFFRNDIDVDESGGDPREIRVMSITGDDVAGLDADGDGIISDAEAEAFAEAHGHGEPGVVSKTVISEDGNKHVILIQESKGGVLHKKEQAVSADERRERFIQANPEADLDGDGSISKAEAEAFAARVQKEQKKAPPKQNSPD